MRRQRARLRASVAVMAIAVVAMACAGDAEDGDTQEEVAADPDIETEESTDVEQEEVDTDAIDRDATLVFPTDIFYDNLDPDASPAGYPITLFFPVYDRLIHIDTGSGDFIPGLAESWEFLEDNTILRLNLREGVTFHDGEEFNAEAVAANFDRSRDHVEGRDESTAALEAVERYEVVDEYTIDLYKDERDELAWAILIPNLSVNLGIMISPAALDDPTLDRNPVGAGPWEFVELEGDRAVYERFDDHWDPDAALVHRIEFTRPASPEAHYNGLLSGEFDLVQLEPIQLEQAEQQPDLNVQVAETLRVWHAYFNHGMEPLDDINIRRAFLYGLDRDGIQAAVTGDTGVPTPQYFPPGYYAFHPDYGEDRYPHDPDRARELIEESEYYDPDGIDIEMEVPNTPEMRVRIAELIQDQMAQVGLNISFTPVEHAAAGDYLAGVKHIDLSPRSRLDPLQHLAQRLDEDAPENPGGHTTDELQALLDEAASLPIDERADVVREISAIQTDEVWSGITMFAESAVWADRCVTGFVPPIATHFTFRGVGILADCD